MVGQQISGAMRCTDHRWLAASNSTVLMSTAVEQRPIVKFQKIRKDDGVVIVGRVRVPTPSTDQSSNGHAYILRRYDTGFVSQTTMFRAAFPKCKSVEEKEEATWIKANFDLAPNGYDGFMSREQMRLAGLWVPVQLATYLAPSYNLSSVVTALGESQPDEEYLKAEQDAQAAAVATPPPHKRRKGEASTPVNGTNGHLATPSKTPSSSSQKTPSSASPQKPVSTSKSRTSPAPSRPTPSRAVKGKKAASPAPASQPAAVPAATSGRRSGRHSTLPKTVEEDEEEEAKPPFPDPAEDIAESQSLVQRLKAEQHKVSAPIAQAVKRTREEAEAPMGLSIQEHDETVIAKEDRALIHPTRVASSWGLPTLAPNQKAAAWGTLAFAIGWGATTYLPQVLPQFF